MSDAENAGERLSDVMGSVTQEVAGIVRAELEVARRQVADQLRQSAVGVGMLGAAAVLGGLALGTATTGLVRTLDRILPGRWGAALATVLYGGAAAGLAVVGAEQVRRHAPEVPRQVAAAMPGSSTPPPPSAGPVDV